MKKILIMTDSASDISKEVEAKYPLKVLNVPIVIDGVEHYEREDFTPVEFFEILNNCQEIPKTSHVTAISFMEAFKEAYDNGYQALIFVSMNKNGSATYNASLSGKEMLFEEYPEIKDKIEIHCIPSYTFSVGYGVPVLMAAQKVIDGADVPEILAVLDDYLTRYDIRFSMYNLKFAKKSGRLSPFSAVVGDMLGIRPIATFREGENVILEKVRGDKSVVPAIAQEYFKYASDDHYIILNGDDTAHGEELEELIYKKTGVKAAAKIYQGSCVAINAGPKIIGIGFFSKDKKVK